MHCWRVRPASQAALAPAPTTPAAQCRLRQPFSVYRCKCESAVTSTARSGGVEPLLYREQQPWQRRDMLLAITTLLTVDAARSARADVGELERQLPVPIAPPSADELPKAYTRTMRRLVKALRTSIEAEADGAKEFEVRRKADGAKELVREFVGKWQGNVAVAGHPTHDEMRSALSELGAFYQRNGPRTRLSSDAKTGVLGHLAAVEAGLPEEEGSLLGF